MFLHAHHRDDKQAPSSRHGVAKGLILIGLYDVIKATLMLILGIGVIHIMHRDIHALATTWLDILHIDPDNRIIHSLIAKTGFVSPQQLELAGIGFFVYALLHYAEGFGLIWQQRWAEYLTIVITGAFIPVEIYEIFHHLSLIKVLVLGINIACVIYVARQLRHSRVKHGVDESAST